MARKTPPKAKRAAPARKVVVVDKPHKTGQGPVRTKSGAKLPAPKLVRSKTLTHQQQAAADRHRIQGV